MNKTSARPRLVQRSAALLALVLFACPLLHALPIIQSSSATFTLDPDVSAPLDEVSSTKSPLDTYHATPPFDFNQTVTENLSQATATGSVFHVETPNLFGLTFPGATGVSQSNNGDFADAATFTIDFTATWTFSSTFGPPLVGYANFWMVGTVSASPGSYIRFELDALFTGDSTRSPVTYDSGMITTPGAWADTFFDAEAMTPNSFLIGETAIISGTLKFTAYASSGYSSVSLGQDSGNIPEPGSCALLAGMGAVLIVGSRRRYRAA